MASTRKHSGSSKNWNAVHRYGTETSSNRWTSGGLTLATQLWEPRNLSLETNDWQQVGPVMEGLAVNGGWAYSSWYRSAAASDQLKGNIVQHEEAEQVPGPVSVTAQLPLQEAEFWQV
ncbi:hypothetical protein ACQZOR_01345 [Lactobacillus delbrueckii subsp. bulgaricus]|uniref:hypothetical protein n=1 Tax=Lactobacillus delbrueckii TaxID=1584 RepID=UPI003D2EEA76